MPVETDLLDPAYLASIEDFSLLTRIVVDGALPGIHRSQRHGRGSEFFQYRDYSRGDDLKLIDWKVFAKRGELVAKSFHEDTSLNCYLVGDSSASMGYKGTRAVCDKLRYGSMLAACFAYVANMQGDRVGSIPIPIKLRIGYNLEAEPLTSIESSPPLQACRRKARTTMRRHGIPSPPRYLEDA